jgi:hypothetical protein
MVDAKAPSVLVLAESKETAFCDGAVTAGDRLAAIRLRSLSQRGRAVLSNAFGKVALRPGFVLPGSVDDLTKLSVDLLEACAQRGVLIQHELPGVPP